jgi:molecular chaperone HtpG
VRRLLAALKEMKEERADRYRTFWAEFGAVLKEGLLGLEEDQDKLLELVLAASTEGPVLVSLGEYVGRMKEGQPAIYYLTAAFARRPNARPTSRPSGRAATRCCSSWIRSTSCGCACDGARGQALTSVSQGGIDLGSGEDGKKEGAVPGEVGDRFKDLPSRCGWRCRTRSRTCVCRSG